MTAQIKKDLDAAVRAKAITAARESKILSSYSSRLKQEINQKGLQTARRGSSAAGGPRTADGRTGRSGSRRGRTDRLIPAFPRLQPRPRRTAARSRWRRPRPRPRRNRHSYAALIDF